MQQTNQPPVCIEEDEIDLVELLKTIKKRRKIVYITTTIITLLAIFYAFLKTPLYKVKSNVQIGFIGKDLIGNPVTIAKRLQVVFHTDEGAFKGKELKKDGAYVESIQQNARKAKDFLEIVTYGLDNNASLKKNKEVVEYLQKEYLPKIEQYILDTKNQIEQLQIQKNNIIKIALPNLQTKIKLIEDMKIPNIDKQIDILKKQELVKLKDKINILKTQKIPEIEKKIEFYSKYKLKDIEEKISFYKEKLKEYNKAIENLYKQFRKENDTKVMIASIQMVNYQNLILDLQNKIKNLELEKVKIIEETIPKLKDQIKNIENIDIKTIQFQIDNIENIKIPNLEKEKEKIKAVEIKKIEDQIVTTKNKIKQIDNKIKVLQFNISPANVQNSKVVGGYILKDHPAKPKRRLIVVVAFVTALILSIFLVFLIEFWEANKKKLEEE